tara:strand:+ start:428 stop:982 length:555 start_codon:yes stop_codon:yes gene_type:complete
MLSTDQKIYWAIKRLVWKIKLFLTYNIIRNIKKLKYYKHIFRLPEVLMTCEDVIDNQRKIIFEKNDYIEAIKDGSPQILSEAIDSVMIELVPIKKRDKDFYSLAKMMNEYYRGNKLAALLHDGVNYNRYNREGGWEDRYEDQRDSMIGGPDYPYHHDELLEDIKDLNRWGVIGWSVDSVDKEVY